MGDEPAGSGALLFSARVPSLDGGGATALVKSVKKLLDSLGGSPRCIWLPNPDAIAENPPPPSFLYSDGADARTFSPGHPGGGHRTGRHCPCTNCRP